MQPDATTRFSNRVEDYVRHRPSYPPEVIALAARACCLTRGSRVADLGCGTGLLARLFLEAGCEVWGVEPNPEMRRAGERSLGAYAQFHSMDGRAEATGLPDGCVDLAVAGQAFHWFEPEAARAELQRILRPRGWVMLIWNERRPAPGFMAEYEAAMARYAPEQNHIERGQIAHFFRGGVWEEARFPNQQRLDAAGLRGRVASSSYAPLAGTAAHGELMETMDRIFARHQRAGTVTMLYLTLVFYGAWRQNP